MSELIVAGFKGEFTADEVLLDLLKMKQIHLIDLDYAVVAARRDDGTIRVSHNNVVVHADATAVGQWGTLLFGGPVGYIIGALIGAVIGETVKGLKKIGIQDDLIKDVSETLEPGSSAIFIMVRKSLSDKVVEELKNFKAKLLRTSLTITNEAELLKELGQNMTQNKG
jgi:uncharacterized membrane protein